MKRVSHPTKVVDKFGSGKHGYTNGVAGVTLPTIVEDTAMDALQEELANSIEGAGVALDSTSRTQLQNVISKKLYAQYGRWTIGATAIASGALMTLTPALTPTSLFTTASNVITFGANGVYRVSLSLSLTCTDTSNPSYAGCQLTVNGGSPFSSTISYRSSATASTPMRVALDVLVYVDNVGGDASRSIHLEVSASAGTVTGAGYLSVELVTLDP